MINSLNNSSYQQQPNLFGYRQNRIQSPQRLDQLNKTVKQHINMKLKTFYKPPNQSPLQIQQQKQKFIATVKKSNNDQKWIEPSEQKNIQSTYHQANAKEFDHQQKLMRQSSNNSKNNKQFGQLNEQSLKQSIEVYANDNQYLSHEQRKYLQKLLSQEEERNIFNLNGNQKIGTQNQNEGKNSQINSKQFNSSSQYQKGETIENSLSYTFAIPSPQSNNNLERKAKNNSYSPKSHYQSGYHVKTDGDLPKGEKEIYLKQENYRQLWNRLLPYLEKPRQLKNSRQHSQHNSSAIIYPQQFNQSNQLQVEENLDSQNDISLNASEYYNTLNNIENINQRPLPLINQKKQQMKSTNLQKNQMKDKQRETKYQLDTSANGSDQNRSFHQGRSYNSRNNNRTSSVTPEKPTIKKNYQNQSQYNRSQTNSFLLQNNNSFNIQREYLKSPNSRYYPNYLNRNQPSPHIENNELMQQYKQCSELLQIVQANLNNIVSNMSYQKTPGENSQQRQYEAFSSNKSDQILNTSLCDGKIKKKNLEKMKLPSLYITRNSPSMMDSQNSQEFQQKIRSSSVNRQYDNIKTSEFHNSTTFSQQFPQVEKQQQSQTTNELEYQQDFEDDPRFSKSNLLIQSTQQQYSSKNQSQQSIHKINNLIPINEQIQPRIEDISQNHYQSQQVEILQQEQSPIKEIADKSVDIQRQSQAKIQSHSREQLIQQQQSQDKLLNQCQNCQKQYEKSIKGSPQKNEEKQVLESASPQNMKQELKQNEIKQEQQVKQNQQTETCIQKQNSQSQLNNQTLTKIQSEQFNDQQINKVKVETVKANKQNQQQAHGQESLEKQQKDNQQQNIKIQQQSKDKKGNNQNDEQEEQKMECKSQVDKQNQQHSPKQQFENQQHQEVSNKNQQIENMQCKQKLSDEIKQDSIQQQLQTQQEIQQIENKSQLIVNTSSSIFLAENSPQKQTLKISPSSQTSQFSLKNNSDLIQREGSLRKSKQTIEDMKESKQNKQKSLQQQNQKDKNKIEKKKQTGNAEDNKIEESNKKSGLYDDQNEEKEQMKPLLEQIKNQQKGNIKQDLQDIQLHIQVNRYIGNFNYKMTFGLKNDLREQNIQIKFSKRFDKNNKIFKIERQMNVIKLPASLLSSRQFLQEKNKYNETQFFECNDCCIELRIIENYDKFEFKQYLLSQYFNQQISKNNTRESSCIDIKQMYIYHDEEFYQRDTLLVEYEKFETLDEVIQNKMTNKKPFTEYELLISYLQLLNNYQQLLSQNIVHQNINATKIAYSYNDCKFKFMPLSKAHVYNFGDFSPRDTMTDKFMINGENNSHPVWIDLINLGIVFCQMKVLDRAENKTVLEKINHQDKTISKQIIQMLCSNECENTLNQCIELIYQNISANSFLNLILQPIQFEMKNEFEKCKKLRTIGKAYESIHQLQDACQIFTSLVEMKENVFGKDTDEYFQGLCDELFAFYKDGQVRQLQVLYEKCKDYLKVIPSLPQSVEYLHYFAEIQWRLGKEHESEEFFNRAFQIISKSFDKIDSRYMTNIYNNKGVNELQRDCYEKSITYFEESLRYCYLSPILNKMMLSSIYNNFSISLLKLNRLEESLDNMLKSLEIKKEIEVLNIDPENSKMAYAISMLYKQAKNNINKSLEYIDMAIELQQTHQNHSELTKYFYKKTQLNFELNQQQQAIDAAMCALPYIEKCDLPSFRQIIQITYDLACLFKNRKLKEQAKIFFSKAYDVGVKVAGPQVLAVQQLKKELDQLK